jgi:hypothetical protein
MKHIFAAVSLAVMALAANAQTQPNQSAIQIFGNIDAGVVSAGKVGANNGNATMFLNSPMDTSRVGLITTESLGQGRSVDLNLKARSSPVTAVRVQLQALVQPTLCSVVMHICFTMIPGAVWWLDANSAQLIRP